MDERKKIIESLERCVFNNDGCISCPYKEHTACKHYLMTDILSFLKREEQSEKRGKEEHDIL